MTTKLTHEVHTDNGKVDGKPLLFTINEPESLAIARETNPVIIKVGDPVQYKAQTGIAYVTKIGIFEVTANDTTEVPAAFLMPGVMIILDNGHWAYHDEITPIAREVVAATRVIDCPECEYGGTGLCNYHLSLWCPDCGGVAGVIPGCTCL